MAERPHLSKPVAQAAAVGEADPMASPDGPDLPEPWSAATVYPDMWVDPDLDPRDSGPEIVDERSALVRVLDKYRLTLEMKCSDLTPEQLAARSVPPSPMSLLGLIRHMADVERYWFRQVMAGLDAPRRFRTSEDRDADWHGAVADPAVVAEAWAAWRDEVDFATRFVESTPDLGLTSTWRQDRPVQLRGVLTHLIAEYARHVGHADLLRERIDGRVGQ